MSVNCYRIPEFYAIMATVLTIKGLTVAGIASAQVSSDGTVQTQVTPTQNQLVITGGTQAGTNLFHSFSQFSVPTGFEAYFNNSSTINNIISRVTGGAISNIEGLIRANGTANLFLINPNGIVFGPNAVVDIGGSFLASTAESIQFADSSQFSARNLQSSGLLTMTVPVGLQFGSNPGTIVNRANQPNPNNETRIGLGVNSGNTLALVGGDLVFPGGKLTVAGGRVELGSVGDNSTVQIIPNERGFELGYQTTDNFQNISLSKEAIVRGNNSIIQLQGREIILNVANVISETQTAESAGDILVNASELVEIIGSKTSNFRSGFDLGVIAPATGRGANILINTQQFILRDGGGIGAGSRGQGAGGNIQINASDSIQLLGTGLTLPSLLTSSTDNTGDGGGIFLNTGTLILQDGGVITAVTAPKTGQGGTITINASESVQVSGSGTIIRGGQPTQILSQISTESGFRDLRLSGLAPGGNLSINTNQLIVTDGGRISAGSFGQGNAGSVDITANSIFLDNQGVITASSEGSGDAGNVTIYTDELSVNNQSEVSVRNIGFGQGGNLTISADAISLNQNSQLSAVSLALDDVTLQELGINPEEFANLPNIGTAGDLMINTSSLNLNNDSQVTVSSFGNGNAGSIEIKAQNVTLDNSSELSAETASGEGGNISLSVSDFLNLRRASTISTTAGTLGGGGNGGNIPIDAQFIVTVPTENSDIIANAFTGRGGNIRIISSGVFGIAERERLTPLNDITASSQFGQVGSIGINRPDVDPQRTLVKLPATVVDAKNLVVQACSPGGAYTRGEFTITGSGGLPVYPNEGIQTSPGLTELGYPEREIFNQSDDPDSRKIPDESLNLDSQRQSSPTAIVEAQGWIVDNNGKVVLTAQSPNVTPHGSGFMPSNCYDLSNRSLSSAPSPSAFDVPQRGNMAE